MGEPTRGFILGKFLPPHAGHLFVCRTAARMVDEMTVLVCSTDAEPIPGDLRADWMRRSLPGLAIVHMHRDIPQEPDEHPDFWIIWKDAIREHHPKPIDRVFGSEAYVFRLAQELQAQPVLLDPDRAAYAASGSAIREDPGGNWRYVPKAVRPYYQKRICVLGPESSGKSTLCATLADTFQTRYMPEYGRTYDAHYRQGGGWTAADFIAIAETHTAMRETLSPDAGPLFFEDTDPLQTLVWAEYLLGDVPEDLAARVARLEPADLYVLLSADVAWRDDGTRYSGDPDRRDWFFRRCRALVRERGLRFAEVGGEDWAGRTAQALHHVIAFRAGLAETSPR